MQDAHKISRFLTGGVAHPSITGVLYRLLVHPLFVRRVAGPVDLPVNGSSASALKSIISFMSNISPTLGADPPRVLAIGEQTDNHWGQT